MALCDLHEMDNCADCTGVTARHQESLKDDTHWQSHTQGVDHFPWVGGGTTIRARFSGRCKGCGRRYEADEAIFSPTGEEGWYAECCYADRIGGS